MTKKRGILTVAHDALITLKDNPGNTLFAGIADVLTFVLFGLVMAIFSEKILYHITHAGNLVSATTGSLTGEAIPSSVIDLLSKSGAMPSVKQAVLLILGMILSVYVVYCIAQGTTWFFAQKITNGKLLFLESLKRFSVVSAVWYALFVIYNIILLPLDYYHVIPQGMGRFSLFLPFLAIIGYFALISYVAIDSFKAKKAISVSFKLGISQVKKFLPAYLLIIACFIIINYLLVLSVYIDSIVQVFIGFLLFIPSLTWSRVFVKRIFEGMNKTFK